MIAERNGGVTKGIIEYDIKEDGLLTGWYVGFATRFSIFDFNFTIVPYYTLFFYFDSTLMEVVFEYETDYDYYADYNQEPEYEISNIYIPQFLGLDFSCQINNFSVSMDLSGLYDLKYNVKEALYDNLQVNLMSRSLHYTFDILIIDHSDKK